MNTAIYHVIVDGMDHWNLEIASWAAQLFLAAIAIVAAAVAAYQLKEMGEFRRQRLRIANAHLLMDLDNRWDSTEMHASRSVFNAIKEEINTKVGRENPLARDDERNMLIQKAWLENLNTKRATNSADYRKLMALCGFFETVGLMVEKDYIKIEDVFELFLGPIVDIDRCFSGHIASLEKEASVPKGLFKHALNLSKRAAKVA